MESIPPNYFSQNFQEQVRIVPQKSQQLFIDIRDFADQIESTDGNLEFTVNWSNAKLHKMNDQNNTYGASMNLAPYDYVTQLELLGISFPKIASEIYFILCIDEFENNIDSSDNNGSRDSFAVIYYDSQSLPVGSVKPLKGKDFCPKIYKFKPHKDNFNKMRIKFKKYGGDIINIKHHFDNENALSSNIEEVKQWFTMHPISLLFEFTIKE